MPAGDKSTPTFVIYINNSRVPGEREADIKKIIITDRINAPSAFTIYASDPENQWRENDDYFIGSRVKILMGYKDEIIELMIGDITGFSCKYKRNQAPEVIISGQNLIHRLNRTIKNQAFSEMAVKDIISQLANNAGLSADVEDLAYEHPLALQVQKSDYNYLQILSERYDCFFSVFDTTLTFKRLQKNMAEDVVLEYGKTLLEFLPEADTSKLVSEVEVFAWNPATHEALTGSSTAQDIDSAGGTVINDQFGGAKTIHIDQYALDQTGADQCAVDILTQNTRDYVTGRGSTFGNPEIRAGSIVKVEGIGEKFSGKYYILSATHTLVPLRGYKTSFTFTSTLGSPTQPGRGSETGQETAVAATARDEQDETEEEQEKNPEITNLKWMKDGEEVTEALVGDIVVLTADVKDIDDGSGVSISIWEKDEVGSDDFIKKFSASVKSGKIEKEWEVEYHEDTDDVESRQEQEEKGYTLPEYAFEVEVSSPEVISVESPVLEVKDWVEFELLDEITGEPLIDEELNLILADGSSLTARSNEKGIIRVNVPPGECHIPEKEEEDDDESIEFIEDEDDDELWQ